MNLDVALKLSDAQLRRLSQRKLAEIQRMTADWIQADVKANQLVYYRPVNEDARRVHLSTAREVGLQGGNKSGKTATMLAEAAIQMTGVIPLSLDSAYPREKLRPPIRVRLVVTSLTSAWDINLKPKLQYFEWSGKLNEDGLAGDPDFGHWGLIPQRFLLNGDWAQSWSEKHRVLTLANGSTLQVMSHDQDLDDFNQGAFHLIVEDEIPPEEIHRANRIRSMEYGGQILVGGTPPDDRTMGVAAAWFFDQILAPGLEGVDPALTFAVELWTENNRTLNEKDIAYVAAGLTPEQREARLHGKSLHLSGLVLPGFTEKPKTWCFRCATTILTGGDACPACGGTDLTTYCHLWDETDLDWPGPAHWPTLFYMDPHQSRPTACAWFKVDPQDGWWQVAEKDIEGDAGQVRTQVEAFEREHGLHPFWRKGDPKITIQPNQFAREFNGRPFTIREAFEEVGFWFQDANTNFTVGRERILAAWQPNPYTRMPKLRIHRSCTRTAYQVGHFTWETSARRDGPVTKELPSRRNSDFPALLRYLANDDPTWRMVQLVRSGEGVHVGAGGVGRNKRTGW